MDDPRKHNANKNKKTTKIMPAPINIGAGARSFGTGSIVLLGAGLVTAALVSALAFKTRRQRRLSSENRKNLSPSPETETVNAPNNLESMIKTCQDSCADSLSFNPPNSSDEVTSIKVIHKNIQNLTLDEKLNDAYEEIVLEYEEEQAVMAAYIESGPPTSEEDSSSEIIERDDGGEEKKNLTLTDNELEEKIDKNLLVCNEVATSIEEYEANEVGIQVEESMPLGDAVAVEEEEDEEKPTNNASEGQETVFINAEAAYVNQINVEDNPEFQFVEEKQDGCNEIVLENSEGSLIEDVLIEEEEAIDEACVHQIEEENGSQVPFVEDEKESDQLVHYDSEQVTKDEDIKEALEDILEIKDHEVALHVQEKHLNDSLNEPVDNQTAAEEDNLPMQLINEEERCKETEEMITEVKTDEIPNVLENSVGDNIFGELKVEEEAIHAACVHQTEEQDAHQLQIVEDEKENDQEIQLDSEQILIEEAIKVTGVDSVNVEDIVVMTDHEVALDAQKMHLSEFPSSTILYTMGFNDSPNVFVDAKEDFSPTQLMKTEEHKETEDELVMKDKIPDVQSIEEDEREETELSSDESKEDMEEESTPDKAKIGNHKIQENMKEKQKIISKNQNKDHHGIIKEDKGSESASRGIELAKGKQQAASEPWNLKLLTKSIVISIWFLCHWYYELPFPEVSLAGSFLFILILACYRNRTKYKYK